MNIDDIRLIVKNIEEKLVLKPEHLFQPCEYHVNLSLDRKKGIMPVAFMDYDPKDKVVKGINPKLPEMLIIFLSRTENYDLLREVKENFM